MPKQLRQQSLKVFWRKYRRHDIDDRAGRVPLDSPRVCPVFARSLTGPAGTDDQHALTRHVNHGDFTGAVALRA
jgi:hypothetical protein